MIDLYTGEDLGEAPPEGDEAWIWFRPEMPTSELVGVSRGLNQVYHPYCKKCDTYGVADPFQKTRRCWCCGRFIPGPVAAAPLINKYHI